MTGEQCSLTPTEVVGMSSGNIAIGTSTSHNCALLEGGVIKCWGLNRWAQLGDGGGGVHCGPFGSNLCRPAPVTVNHLGGRAQAIATGSDHTCALLEDGSVQCWGDNGQGQLGIGVAGLKLTLSPVTVVGLDPNIQYPVAGGGHTCILIDDGSVKCWGANRFGQIGDSTVANRNIPVAVLGLDGGVKLIAAANANTCAVTSAEGGVKCWGSVAGLSGSYDYGFEEGAVPRDIPGLASGVQSVAAYGEWDYGHACAVLASGDVKCWGNNLSGQLGDGTLDDSPTPVKVVGLAGKAMAVDVGQRYSCALIEGGAVQCWGSNGRGQLGNSNAPMDSNTPVTVKGLDLGAISITAGFAHTCALLKNNSVKCWGSHDWGQIGDGTPTSINYGDTSNIRDIADKCRRSRRRCQVYIINFRPHLCPNGQRQHQMLGRERICAVG